MARPQKTGLDYFPMDVDYMNDEKVLALRSIHGNIGELVFVRLLTRIYDAGYFIEWGELQNFVLAGQLSVDGDEVSAIVDSCLRFKIFNQTLFDEHKILTSEAIQERWLKATERRSSAVIDDIYRAETSKCIQKPRSAGVNDCKSTQSKVKESRVEETREDTNKQPPQISLVEAPPPKKKRVAKNKFSLDVVISDFFTGTEAENVKLASQQWIDYRKQKRVDAWTETTWRMQFEKYEHDSDAFVAAVKNSISQGWQGLFAEKGFKDKDQVWAELTEQYGANDL